MIVLRSRIILTCAILFMMVSSGHGEMNKIRVAYTEWYPYTYQENGEARGFELDTFREVMKTMNLTPEFAKYPWKRCLDSLKRGQADVLISLLKTPEREAFTDYPETHISISKTMFFTKADKKIPFKGDFSALKGYSIGVIMGFSYGEAFDKADYLKKDEAWETQMLIKKLLAGRNDLAAENQAVISANAKKMGVADQIRFIEPPIHTKKLYVGFSKANNLKKQCDEFSKALGRFKKSEGYKAILEKYGISLSEMEE